ncbi:hypothetical protein [uncultured Bacteroides sp.]|uniref:hypothetical protein n=1 Tax=uncultured Bacteroides sp. TaxID=162156 RepID=UPI002593D947|nr:hypothetical protein [uncultured Bacteroides sp.]
MKSREEELAKSVSAAMGEDILNDVEMEMTEGGKIVENALSKCSNTNCAGANCVAGCGGEQQESFERNENQAFL